LLQTHYLLKPVYYQSDSLVEFIYSICPSNGEEAFAWDLKARGNKPQELERDVNYTSPLRSLGFRRGLIYFETFDA
jgi:hypothetical protein